MAPRDRRIPLAGDHHARRVREILTPEGVTVQFVLAEMSTRVAAFAVDTLIMIVMTVALFVPALMLALADSPHAMTIVGLAVLATFFVWNFYFIWFELNWQGSTPGKRWLHIRAIDAQGGPASADAIVARNLMRSVETILPLAALIALAAGAEQGGNSGWLALGSTLWLFLFALLPLLNRDRLRVGDLVAGTIVIRNPESNLEHDLAEQAAREAYAFTPEQLDVYGIYELQVLEQVLRGTALDAEYAAAIETVAQKVSTKIGSEAKPESPELFLRAFYAALRARLEHKLLFGKRKEDKYDK